MCLGLSLFMWFVLYVCHVGVIYGVVSLVISFFMYLGMCSFISLFLYVCLCFFHSVLLSLVISLVMYVLCLLCIAVVL